MAYVDVLRVGLGNGDYSKLHSTLIVLEDRHAPHPYIRPHETPSLPHKQYFLHHVSKRDVSAHFCVLETQDTQGPPHITNPPVSDLLSAAQPA